MNTTNFPPFVISLLMVLTSMTIVAQNTKEAVILYNSQVVRANITPDGNVTSIIKEEPDFLKGFELKIQDYGQFVANQQLPVKNEPFVAVSSGNYSVVKKEYKTVYFEKDRATLTDETIAQLDQIIAYLRENVEVKIIAMTLSKFENGLVSKNRLNSIRTYFKIRGIGEDRILFESLFAEMDAHEVKLGFIE
jgi:outer membrane protein OmpA-like peptidoglycan-associated protein